MHTEMEKVKELKNELICKIYDCKEDINPEMLGELVDAASDLAEVEEKCWKACYYKSIVEAMKEAKEEDEIAQRMGYNTHRSSTTGRYTSGYTAPMHMMHDPDFDHAMNKINHRMGYVRPYDNYMEAKRSYTETHSQADKQKMDHHAMEHVEDCVETMRDIWSTASPELRTRMKEDMTKLINDMKA